MFPFDYMNCIPKVNHTQMTKERVLHMYGVAEFMRDKYDLFDCQYLSKDRCYVLGFMHDVGYIQDKIPHEEYGAEMLNFDASYLLELYTKWHTYSPQQLVTEDEEFIEETYSHEGEDPYTLIHPELVLLWCADMMVESTGEHAGEVVGFTARLEGIKSRFGADSDVYHSSLDKVNWLLDYLTEHNIKL